MLSQKQNLEVSQLGDSGHVIPGTVSGDVCHPIDRRNVTPGACLGGGHPEDCEGVTTGAWSAKCGVSGDSGHVTPGKGSWRQGHPGECGHVTSDAGSGRDLPWLLWMLEYRCRVWEFWSP